MFSNHKENIRRVFFGPNNSNTALFNFERGIDLGPSSLVQFVLKSASPNIVLSTFLVYYLSTKNHLFTHNVFGFLDSTN